MNQLLGAEDQLFTMEFPARPLNKNTYQYQADGTYSSLTKPITVQEAEFSLSDAIYDNASIIQGGNGERLSQVYRSGSGTEYPVQFSPMDWFKALEPNLHPKDLTMSADALAAEYSAKKKELRNLEEKFAELERGEISKEEIELTSLKQDILSQINDIKADLDCLSPLVSSTMAEQLFPSSNAPKTEEDEAQSLLLPQNRGDAADSNFMDIILTSESIQKRNEDSSSASSPHQKASKEDTSKIEMGFRVTKVSNDRGPWFSPNVFKMTQNFPTAFVIAKDITIRVKVTESEMQENINYAESQNSSSGGLFGFSASSAGSAQSSSESSYIGSRNNYIYIRIPGPQILGWFQQLVPQDVSEK